MTKFITKPDWPAPENIITGITTRNQGVSKGTFASNNLALHVSDDKGSVLENRRRLAKELDVPIENFYWLDQVHGVNVAQAPFTGVTKADAVITREKNTVCCILTADCLPIFLCNRQGTEVAAIHAGWRSLVNGVVENTVSALQTDAVDLMAFLGPAISQKNFEVGAEVKQVFTESDDKAGRAFLPSKRPGRFMADLYQLAQLRLQALGIENVEQLGTCTYADDKEWYSYRRDGETGRMLSFIFIRE